MSFQIGGSVYAHADAKVILRPRKPGGQQKTFLSAKSFEGDANVESFLVEGTSHEAVAIGVGVIKPDWKISLANWDEVQEYAGLCGRGYQIMLHDLTIVFSQGARTATVTIGQCVIEKGWGVKSDSGGGPTVEMSGKARTLDMNGIGGVPAPGGGGGGGSLLEIGASVSIGGLSLGVGLSF